MSIVKHIVAESGAETQLRCFTCTSVVLASSTTASTTIATAASTTATVSSASSARAEKEEELSADVTIGLLLLADVTIGLLFLADVTIGLRGDCPDVTIGHQFNLVCLLSIWRPTERHTLHLVIGVASSRDAFFVGAASSRDAFLPMLRSVSDAFYQHHTVHSCLSSMSLVVQEKEALESRNVVEDLCLPDLLPIIKRCISPMNCTVHTSGLDHAVLISIALGLLLYHNFT